MSTNSTNSLYAGILEFVISGCKVSVNNAGYLSKKGLEEEIMFEARERGLTAQDIEGAVQYALDHVKRLY